METFNEESALNLPPPPSPLLPSTSSTFFKTLVATPAPPPCPPPTSSAVSPVDMLQFSKPPPFLFTAPPPEIISDQCSEASSDPTRNPRYKTEICRNFKERARCIYGDQCQFAHGRRELRDVVRNNKYKTKMCQKYWVAGYCAYGPRCNFLHDEDKAMSELAMKEYGLTKKPEDKSRRNSLSDEFKSKYEHQADFNRLDCLSPFSSNPSPVNLLEVESHGSLDYLMSSTAQITSVDYCFGPFLATIPASRPNSVEADKQIFEAKKIEDDLSSDCSL